MLKNIKTSEKLVKCSVVFVDKRKWWFTSVSVQVIQSSSPILDSIICCIQKLCNKYSILNLVLLSSYITKAKTKLYNHRMIICFSFAYVYISEVELPTETSSKCVKGSVSGLCIVFYLDYLIHIAISYIFFSAVVNSYLNLPI